MSNNDKKKNNSTKSIVLKLNQDELTHLRDLFGILMPPNYTLTLSESLALLYNNEKLENKLWDQVYNLCKHNNISIDTDANDFAVMIATPPKLEVQQVKLECDDIEESVAK